MFFRSLFLAALLIFVILLICGGYKCFYAQCKQKENKNSERKSYKTISKKSTQKCENHRQKLETEETKEKCEKEKEAPQAFKKIHPTRNKAKYAINQTFSKYNTQPSNMGIYRLKNELSLFKHRSNEILEL